MIRLIKISAYAMFAIFLPIWLYNLSKAELGKPDDDKSEINISIKGVKLDSLLEIYRKFDSSRPNPIEKETIITRVESIQNSNPPNNQNLFAINEKLERLINHSNHLDTSLKNIYSKVNHPFQKTEEYKIINDKLDKLNSPSTPTKSVGGIVPKIFDDYRVNLEDTSGLYTHYLKSNIGYIIIRNTSNYRVNIFIKEFNELPKTIHSSNDDLYYEVQKRMKGIDNSSIDSLTIGIQDKAEDILDFKYNLNLNQYILGYFEIPIMSTINKKYFIIPIISN